MEYWGRNSRHIGYQFPFWPRCTGHVSHNLCSIAEAEVAILGLFNLLVLMVLVTSIGMIVAFVNSRGLLSWSLTIADDRRRADHRPARVLAAVDWVILGTC